MYWRGLTLVLDCGRVLNLPARSSRADPADAQLVKRTVDRFMRQMPVISPGNRSFKPRQTCCGLQRFDRHSTT